MLRPITLSLSSLLLVNCAALRPPTLGQLVDDRPLTTDFRDAENHPTAALPDDLPFSGARPLQDQPRTQEGGFLLKPGTYEGTLETYCLQPGTHRPGLGT